jgi:phosphoglucosamine mutase
MARAYFGTDGVRGVVGESLTEELVERLGKAGTLWAGGGRVLVGRDTRGSGPALERALARGIASAGGTAVLAGVLPTPAVSLLVQDLGVVLSASHNPPEYNGVKFFDRDGSKLSDAAEEGIEGLLEAASPGGGRIEAAEGEAERYLEHVLGRFGTDLTGLRIAVDCANGAFSSIAPDALRQLGADVTAIGSHPDGANINIGCGATDLAMLRKTVLADRLDLGIAFDGDGDRVMAVDETGAVVDGDRIVAAIALARKVDRVAVTVMTNLGFHRLMADHGIAVDVTDVGDRYVLEALRREGGLLGGEQSGHVIWLDGHRTGDGLTAALLLLDALDGRRLSEVAGAMPVYPQVLQNIRAAGPAVVPEAVARLARELNEKLAGSGRVLVRPSGTEPLLRVLAEAPTEAEAADLCGTVVDLVRRELGVA